MWPKDVFGEFVWREFSLNYLFLFGSLRCCFGRVPRKHRLCGWRGDLALPDANAVNNTHSSCAPNRLTPSGGTNADTINAFHACPACFTDSGDHAVRLLNWRKRDRLCR
jgi:hypothetical protein